MNLTTLEQSKKLREWGAPQDTDWAYIQHSLGDPDLMLKAHAFDYISYIAAYSLEDLIGWLNSDPYKLTYWETDETVEHFVEVSTRKDNAYASLVGFRTVRSKESSDSKSWPKIAEGTTPLEAVYALAEAVKGGK